jgi:hypothetical protein
LRRSRPVPPEGHLENDWLLHDAAELPDIAARHLLAQAFDRALSAILALIAEANRYVVGKSLGLRQRERSLRRPGGCHRMEDQAEWQPL